DAEQVLTGAISPEEPPEPSIQDPEVCTTAHLLRNLVDELNIPDDFEEECDIITQRFQENETRSEALRYIAGYVAFKLKSKHPQLS
ncbi:hypothetical protein, partial [Klebsiella pneumoniae]